MLNREPRNWLLAMADPSGPALPPPRRPLSASAFRDLFRLADRHGVLPAVIGNVKNLIARGGPTRIVQPADGGVEAAAQESAKDTAAIVVEAERTLTERTAFSLVLRSQWAQIRPAMEKASLPVVVLKGPEFADRLYSRPALRTFTDLDILVPPEAAAEAVRIIESLGYTCTEPGKKYQDGYGEITFRPPGAGGAVELHTNLVNSPSLRQGVSVAYGDLQFIREAGGAAKSLSATSLLVIAAVHGAVSHQFDRVQILCDIAQAVRGAAGELDEKWLARFASRGSGSMALAAALDLAGRFLGEGRCRSLCDRLELKRPLSIRLLLSRGVLVRCHAYLDSFRRQAFREMLKGS